MYFSRPLAHLLAMGGRRGVSARWLRRRMRLSREKRADCPDSEEAEEAEASLSSIPGQTSDLMGCCSRARQSGLVSS